MSAKKTRHGISSSITTFIGKGKEFQPSELPTLREILQYVIYLQEKHLIINESDRQNYPISKIANDVTEVLINQWKSANTLFVPPVTVSHQNIKYHVIKSWNKISDIERHRITKESEISKIVSKLDKLYDITKCKCPITLCADSNCVGCKFKAHTTCTCQKTCKLPKIELAFIKAQREKDGGKSTLTISGIDFKETRRMNKSLKRKIGDHGSTSTYSPVTNDLQAADDEMITSSSEKGNDSETDDTNAHKMYNRMNVQQTALATVRYGVSAAATAAIATAALVDAKVIEENDTHLAVDRSKIQRAKDKIMTELRSKRDTGISERNIKCIVFDGKKTETKIMKYNQETKRYYKSSREEEHYAVTAEPEGEYLFHFTPLPAIDNVKPAEQIAKELFGWMKDTGVDKTIVAIGGDSTNINTGWKGGSIQFVEKMLGRRLIWLICALHTNELPLRHLIIELDGSTLSGNRFSGPLGKLLPKVTQLPIKENINALLIGEGLINLPTEVINDLSADQYYGYRMVHAIQSGIIPKDLVFLEVGPICHSRWLTTANRFLRLWISVHGLADEAVITNLKRIIEFIMGVYYPMWFRIKVQNDWLNGPRHVLTQLRLLRHQNEIVRNIVTPYVKTSCWYAHSEIVLQAMISSDCPEERQFAVNKILAVRSENNAARNTSHKERRQPQLNMQANSMENLISWNNPQEPQLTKDMTNDDIRSFSQVPMPAPHFPVHTQTVERCIALLTKACNSVYGYERRDGFMVATMAHRQVLPVFRSKHQIEKMIKQLK